MVSIGSIYILGLCVYPFGAFPMQKSLQPSLYQDILKKFTTQFEQNVNVQFKCSLSYTDKMKYIASLQDT